MQSIEQIFHTKQNQTIEKIYLACFNEYKSQLEITKLFQKKWSSNISKVINNHPEFFDRKEKQKSWKNARYRAKIDPLIKIINMEINLTDKETSFLTDSLNKNSFRKIILYENKYHKIIDILNVLQYYANAIQITKRLISEYKKFPKLPKKELLIELLLQPQDNILKEIIKKVDKTLDDEYNKSPTKIETQDFDNEKFKRFIDFRNELGNYSDELINKLTRLTKKSTDRDISNIIAIEKILNQIKEDSQ